MKRWAILFGLLFVLGPMAGAQIGPIVGTAILSPPFAAGAGSVAVTALGAKQVGSGANTTTITGVTFPTSSIIVVYGATFGNVAMTVSDTVGNKYISANVGYSAGTNMASGIFYAASAGVSGMTLGTITLNTPSGADAEYVAAAYATGVTLLDKNPGGIFTTLGTTASISTGVLATQPEVVIGVIGGYASGAATGISASAAGFSNLERFSSGSNSACGSAGGCAFSLDYQIVHSTASVVYSPVFSATSYINSNINSFR